MAVAACLVIGLAWMFNSPADSTEIARAQRALNEGRTEEALVRLSGIRPERLRTEAERVVFRRMQEEATFRAAFADLKAGRDAEAAAHCLAARARGVDSPRLSKLYRIATADPATRGQEWEKELLEESTAEKPR